MVERVVLVGFMCSGKSTVGRLLADRLGWDFIDFDEAIERRTGKKVAEIFRDHGEEFFREMEAELTEQVEDRWKVVVAPGGGWVTRPELVERLRTRSLVVWLRVRPEAVYERHRRQADGARPLLAVEEPLAAIASILAARTPLYERADAAVDTDDRSPAEVAELIAEMLGAERTGAAAGGDKLTGG